MELQGNVKDLLVEEKTIQLGTASAEGIPNVCHIGAKFLREDGKFVIVDNYMKKTKANVLENPRVCILLRREKESYQLKGVCRYVDEGEVYEEAKAWMKVKGEKYPAKGALVIEVTEVYDSAAGSNAGNKLS